MLTDLETRIHPWQLSSPSIPILKASQYLPNLPFLSVFPTTLPFQTAVSSSLGKCNNLLPGQPASILASLQSVLHSEANVFFSKHINLVNSSFPLNKLQWTMKNSKVEIISETISQQKRSNKLIKSRNKFFYLFYEQFLVDGTPGGLSH